MPHLVGEHFSFPRVVPHSWKKHIPEMPHLVGEILSYPQLPTYCRGVDFPRMPSTPMPKISSLSGENKKIYIVYALKNAIRVVCFFTRKRYFHPKKSRISYIFHNNIAHIAHFW